ncbi:MAG: hypothetical protein ETSY2_16345 [Candidatus Entotheonella gemina]|uniref:Glyoxalase-like domain-containing protein n=1 Tax=Candidatus Entotheonella gemina TaxID=1429439 RepID=W4M8Q3_9BACT|nr:MAG: hypothetical protein ETSY2_16345 [Candidatus Entotheonella gemina]
MPFELDHVLICTHVDAPEADRLVNFGLTEGPSNVHPGQGTANRRFFFHNAMLECFWVHTPEEARNATTRPTHLWPRWQGRGGETSPFAICLRPQSPQTDIIPFPTWPYRPAYVPGPMVIHMGENASVVTEPLLFYNALGGRPDQSDSPPPLDHPMGFREVTSLRLHSPEPSPASPTLQDALQTGVFTLHTDTEYWIEVGFNQERQGKTMDFRPALPLVFCW